MRDKGSKRLHAFPIALTSSHSRRFPLGLPLFGARRLLVTFYPIQPRPRVDFAKNLERSPKGRNRIPSLTWKWSIKTSPISWD